MTHDDLTPEEEAQLKAAYDAWFEYAETLTDDEYDTDKMVEFVMERIPKELKEKIEKSKREAQELEDEYAKKSIGIIL